MPYFPLDAFSISQYITNPYSLSAFAIAAIMTYFISKNRNNRKKIETVSEGDRADLIIKTAEKIHLDINAVPKNERRDLIIKVLNNRIKTQIIFALVTIIIAFLIFLLVERSKNSNSDKTLPSIKKDSLLPNHRDSSNSKIKSHKEFAEVKNETNAKTVNNLEISIQLTKAYKKLLLNENDASIIANSTPLNPRIIIKSNATQMQIIKIINIEGDTCILKGIFDKKNRKDFPIRFTPECKTYN